MTMVDTALSPRSLDLFDGSGAARPLANASTSAATARRRKLHVGHFAFMRALVQGVDVQASWDRYLRIDGESPKVTA